MADNSSRYSYLFDPHGSVSLLVDYSGSNPVKASYGYTAYGSSVSGLTKTASGFNPNVNAYRYTGKRLDTGSGTLDMGARRYALSTNRFLQVDQYHGALANLRLALDPLTQNRYALAAGNPVTYVEVDGHKLIAEMFAGADAGPARTSRAASRGEPVAGGAGGRAATPRASEPRGNGARGGGNAKGQRTQPVAPTTRPIPHPDEGTRGAQAAEAGPTIKPGSAGGPTAGKPFSRSVKQEARDRDPTSTCVFCGRPGTGTQVDHAIPRSRGGNATIDNAQLACPWCNPSKGARNFPVNPPPGFEGRWPPPWWSTRP